MKLVGERTLEVDDFHLLGTMTEEAGNRCHQIFDLQWP